MGLEEKFQQPLADIKNLCTFADPNDGACLGRIRLND
jgi:hypothetical protein